MSVRLIAPAMVALAVALMAAADRLELDHNLQIIAPGSARPGEPVPIRALLFGHLRRLEGAELVQAPVRVELLDRESRPVAAARLGPSYARSLEGSVRLPGEFRGPLTLRAVARLADGEVIASTPLEARADPPALRTGPRSLGPLQRFSAGPIRREDGEEDPPSELELRVIGGACVPEQPCELLVWVGFPPASVEIEPNASVTPLERDGKALPQTEGLVRLSVVTHGPEAESRLLARRGGRLVASRAFRLPVALAATSLRLDRSVWSSGERIGFRLQEKQEGAGCIVDVFRDNRWLRTGWLPDCDRRSALPFGRLEPGVWRLQARRDPFGFDTASVRLFHVRRPGEDHLETTVSIARYVGAYRSEDEFARRAAAQPALFLEAGPETPAAFLLAALERELVLQPPAAESYPQAMEELGRQRVLVRRLCLAALASAGLALALLIARRGLRAASRAREIMAGAGDGAAQSARKRVLMTLTVLCAAFAVLLAFLAIAMYVVARGNAPWP